jgi:hypothetical protein
VVQRVLDDPELRALLPPAVLAPNGGAPDLPWIIRYSLPFAAISGAFFMGLLVALFRAKSDRSDPAMPAQSGPHQ